MGEKMWLEPTPELLYRLSGFIGRPLRVKDGRLDLGLVAGYSQVARTIKSETAEVFKWSEVEIASGVLTAENIESSQPNDTVDHPSHYCNHPAGIECISIIEHFNFNVGNAIKYLWRCGVKPGTSAVEDLKKASWYCLREAERLEKAGVKK